MCECGAGMDRAATNISLIFLYAMQQAQKASGLVTSSL